MGPDFPPTAQRSRVRVLSQREAVPELPLDSPPTSSPSMSSPETSPNSPSDYQMRLLAVLDGIARVLGARMILLLAVLGGIALAYLATVTATQMTIAVVVTYNLTIVCPLIWLTAMRN